LNCATRLGEEPGRGLFIEMKKKNQAKRILDDGRFKTLAELAKKYKLSKQALEYRLKKGIELSLPKKGRKKIE
jgi:Zn-dependent peptidase ImmA (M78 family)